MTAYFTPLLLSRLDNLILVWVVIWLVLSGLLSWLVCWKYLRQEFTEET